MQDNVQAAAHLQQPTRRGKPSRYQFILKNRITKCYTRLLVGTGFSKRREQWKMEGKNI
jgi:hypothetical protein